MRRRQMSRTGRMVISLCEAGPMRHHGTLHMNPKSTISLWIGSLRVGLCRLIVLIASAALSV